MFISKDEVADLKSKAGQVGSIQSEINQIKKQLDLSEDSFWSATFISELARKVYGLPKKTLKTVIKEITDRLDQQEKMQKMLFAHLGIEYAKITEETKDGKREKEVLRKVKKQKSA